MKYVSKINDRNLPYFYEEKIKQVEEAQRVSIKRNSKRPTPTYLIIIIAKFKDKETFLKAAREK